MEERHAALMNILCLANRISRECAMLEGVKRSAGVSGVNARILAYLINHEGGEVYQRDLEEEFSIRRSTVSKILGLMEQKGLVRRISVERDARLKRILVTDAARELCQSASSELTAFEVQATRDLNGEEIEALRALLKRIDGALTQ